MTTPKTKPVSDKAATPESKIAIVIPFASAKQPTQKPNKDRKERFLRALEKAIKKATRAIESTDDTTRLKPIRVAIKRLQILATILTQDKKNKALTQSLKKLRKVKKALSTVRDVEVFEELLLQYTGQSFVLMEKSKIEEITKNLAEPLKELTQLDKLIKVQAEKSDCKKIGQNAAKKLSKKIRKDFGKAKKSNDPIRLHDWRKPIKDLSFIYDFAIAKRPQNENIRIALKALGQDLGKLNDLYNLRTQLGALALDGLTPTIKAKLKTDLKRDMKKLISASLEAGADLVDQL